MGKKQKRRRIELDSPPIADEGKERGKRRSCQALPQRSLSTEMYRKEKERHSSRGRRGSPRRKARPHTPAPRKKEKGEGGSPPLASEERRKSYLPRKCSKPSALRRSVSLGKGEGKEKGQPFEHAGLREEGKKEGYLRQMMKTKSSDRPRLTTAEKEGRGGKKKTNAGSRLEPQTKGGEEKGKKLAHAEIEVPRRTKSLLSRLQAKGRGGKKKTDSLRRSRILSRQGPPRGEKSAAHFTSTRPSFSSEGKKRKGFSPVLLLGVPAAGDARKKKKKTNSRQKEKLKGQPRNRRHLHHHSRKGKEKKKEKDLRAQVRTPDLGWEKKTANTSKHPTE